MTKQKLEPTPWRGSPATYKMVYDQIKARWGEDMAKRYNPSRNARTWNSWKESGFRVKRGEKALKSVTFKEIVKDGEVVDVYRKTVNLFYFPQLERIIK